MGIEVDGANQKLILDSDGDTYLEAATDDTIKVYVSGAHDATISANAINILSGTTLTIDSGATITNSGTANGFSSADPSSADGDSLGTASAEWSDLYLADGGIVYFGNDQDIRLTHNADKGLILKHSATADDKPVILTLQTGETDMAQDDVMGKIEFQAPDEGTGTDAVLVSAAIQAVAEGDFSSSSNATRLEFMTGSSEAATSQMSISSGGIVGIGAVPTGDLGVGLHIKTADSGASVHAEADELVLENGTGAGNCGMSILTATDGTGGIYFGDSGGTKVGLIDYNHSINTMTFATNTSEAMRIQSDGAVLIGKTSSTDTVEGVKFAEAGVSSVFTVGDDNCIVANRQTNDGSVISIKHANSQEGNIAVSGSTVAYNTFCGTHWSRLADNSKPTILRGTVMESIATMCDWYQAVADVAESTDSAGNITPAHKVNENIALPNGKSVGDAVTFTSKGKEYTGVYVKEDNERLPMAKISDTADSKKVYGVFMAWDDNDDGLDEDVNDMYIASLGSFVVRIHKDETVAIGDYLVSNGDGTAKKQADDILRSSTIAKVTSTTKTHTHADGSYCVPCTLHCG